VTDPNNPRPEALAHEVLQDPAMDQALDWLIALQCPQPGQQAEFQAWLARDPARLTQYKEFFISLYRFLHPESRPMLNPIE
jgi:ferric-dicitrate binding protein FerR (iron transport regulator)